MNIKVFISVVLIFNLITSDVFAVPIDGNPNDNLVHTNEYTSTENALLTKLNTKCTNHDVGSCMMLKLLTYFNYMLKKSSIEIGDVEISQTSTEPIEESTARSLNNMENMTEEDQFTEILSEKAVNFVKTRSLKWKILDDADLVISGGGNKEGGLNLEFSLKPNESFEGRRRKNNNMGAMMAAAALKIGLLKALAFKGLALLVGKALLVSKLALVLAAVIGLKKLFSQEKHVTYEVVAHPHHESHHEHSFSSGGGGHDSYGGGGGGGGWGRNFNAGDLAYRAHIPPK